MASPSSATGQEAEDRHDLGWALPSYARTQLVLATVALFTVNAWSFTAFAYLPGIVDVRLVGSLGVVPYGLFVAMTARAYRDFFSMPEVARRLVALGAFYGLVVLTFTLLSLGEAMVLEICQAAGLWLTVTVLGALLPSLLGREDYARIIVWTLRALVPLALLGLALELTEARSVAGVELLRHPLRDASRTTWSLFVHHSVVAHVFQWLPVLALAARPFLPRGSLNHGRLAATWLAVDVAAATFCAAYVLASGSRQGIAYLGVAIAVTGAACLWRTSGETRRWRSWQMISAFVLPATIAVIVVTQVSKATIGFALIGAQLTGRVSIWHDALTRIFVEQRALRGFGIRPELVNGWMPHNSPLAYFGAFGWLGFGAFVAILAGAILAMTSGRPPRDESAGLRLAVVTAIFCLLLQMGIEDIGLRAFSSANLAVWLLFGCALPRIGVGRSTQSLRSLVSDEASPTR